MTSIPTYNEENRKILYKKITNKAEDIAYKQLEIDTAQEHLKKLTKEFRELIKQYW